MGCCKNRNKPSIESKLGGWSIDKSVYQWIRSNAEDGETILELGSGYGTEVLSKHYSMFSIEHDRKFLGRFSSTFIHSQLLDSWYDPRSISDFLPRNYTLLLVDGPPGDRSGILNHLELFNPSKFWLINNTDREKDRMIFEEICLKLNSEKYLVFDKFSVIIV